MTPEEIVEQAANLLALWKEHLPKYKKYNEGWPGKEAVIHRFKLCIDELESVLTGKPFPPGGD